MNMAAGEALNMWAGSGLVPSEHTRCAVLTALLVTAMKAAGGCKPCCPSTDVSLCS